MLNAYAEAWRGGLHKEAQVAEETQAGPHSTLNASSGTIALSKADSSCTAYYIYQAHPLELSLLQQCTLVCKACLYGPFGAQHNLAFDRDAALHTC